MSYEIDEKENIKMEIKRNSLRLIMMSLTKERDYLAENHGDKDKVAELDRLLKFLDKTLRDVQYWCRLCHAGPKSPRDMQIHLDTEHKWTEDYQ